MILGHIGVRAGSKGVPGKNFREICGKPLIQWSLDQLLEHPEIDEVVVSTDDPEIYAYCVAQGTLDIGLRPANLATDTAGKFAVWKHAYSISQPGLRTIDAFVDLDATHPLRLPQDIDGALELAQNEQPDMVMSCCEARKNPYFNLVEPDATGSLQVSKPLPSNVLARQQAPVVYEHVGLIYVLKPDYLRQASSLFQGRVIPYVVDAERCHDIDTPYDFTLVEFLLGEQIKAGLKA